MKDPKLKITKTHFGSVSIILAEIANADLTDFMYLLFLNFSKKVKYGHCWQKYFMFVYNIFNVNKYCRIDKYTTDKPLIYLNNNLLYSIISVLCFS